MQSIVMYGNERCSDCARSKRFLESKGLAYEWHDIEHEEGAAEAAVALNIRAGRSRINTIPVIVIGEQILAEPTDEELAAALGLSI
jgi:glutaredoxin